jgi:hypothetical protein
LQLLAEQRPVDQLGERRLQLRPDLTLLMMRKRRIRLDLLNDLLGLHPMPPLV